MVSCLTPQKVIPQLPLPCKTQSFVYVFISIYGVGQLDSEHFKKGMIEGAA